MKANILNWTSLVLFVLSLVTGILIHYAHHNFSYDVWHDLSVVHIIINAMFLVTYITHIVRHLKWYKLVFKKNKKLSKITLLLSVFSLLTVLTGIGLLLFGRGQGTHLGLIHYILGLLFGFFCIWHLFMRFKPLKIKKKK